MTYKNTEQNPIILGRLLFVWFGSSVEYEDAIVSLAQKYQRK